MSYPYPQDRHRDRKEKGEQPYKDAKEAMAQERAEIDAQAPLSDAGAQAPEDREAEMQDRLTEVTREIREDRDEDM